MDMLFPAPWLAEKATSDPHAEFNGNTETNEMGKTNRDVQSEVRSVLIICIVCKPLPRFNKFLQGFLRRIAITKPQQLLGHVSQMAAALTHNVSPARLAYVAANIPKIAIVTGDDDHLVRPSGSERIKKGMDSELGESDRERVELLRWEATGHGIHAQREVEFNRLVERCVREGRKAMEEGFKGRDL